MLLNFYIAISVFAEDTSLSIWLAKETRPTALEFVHSDSVLDEQITSFPYNGTDVAVVRGLIQTLPRIVESVDRFWPQASIITVGRDMDFIADGLEIYFDLHARQTPIQRVGVSWSSFENGELEEEFFRETGIFDLPRPIVVMDTVNTNGEQLKKFLYYLYREEIRRGVPRNEIRKNIGGVGFAEETTLVDSHGLYLENADIVFRLMNAVLRGNFSWKEIIFPIFSPEEVFGIPINHVGFRGFSSRWHEKYQTFARERDGVVRSRPGPTATPDERLRVLFLQSALYREMCGGDPSQDIEVLKHLETIAEQIPAFNLLHLVKSFLDRPGLRDSTLQSLRNIANARPVLEHILRQTDAFRYTFGWENFLRVSQPRCDQLFEQKND